MTTASLAAELLAALDAGRQIAPLAGRVPGFGRADAYAVAAELRRLRQARGEKPVGRKIGFTNRGIWAEYAVYEPICGDMYNTTVADAAAGMTLAVSHLPEPRIEPEIVLGIAGEIRPGMAPVDLFEAVGWIAHGFEIVQSVFPAWRFAVEDCIADGGLHGRLAVGPRLTVGTGNRAALFDALTSFGIELSRNGAVADRGTGANVLDGPLHALSHLVEVLGRDPANPMLRPGEMVTTGTLTRAFPVVPGERWSTRLEGIDLPGLDVRIG